LESFPVKPDKIQFSPYGVQENPSEPIGCLLRLFFQNTFGYADLRPWPSFFDAPLEDQLQAILQKRTTPLLKSSFFCAQTDAFFRQQKKSCFENIRIPLSHHYLKSPSSLEWNSPPLGLVKVKTESDPLTSAKSLFALKNSLLRIDCNSHWSFSDFHHFFSLCPTQKIDFFEDPVCLSSLIKDMRNLIALQEKHQLRFAWDHTFRQYMRMPQASLKDFLLLCKDPIFILKPAIDSWEWCLEVAQTGCQIVVTNYLGHPFGALYDSWIAGKLLALFPQQILPCGLLSIMPNMETKAPLWFQSAGPGFGCDALLKECKWKDLT
jgi:hypothetical protein